MAKTDGRVHQGSPAPTSPCLPVNLANMGHNYNVHVHVHIRTYMYMYMYTVPCEEHVHTYIHVQDQTAAAELYTVHPIKHIYTHVHCTCTCTYMYMPLTNGSYTSWALLSLHTHTALVPNARVQSVTGDNTSCRNRGN